MNLYTYIYLGGMFVFMHLWVQVEAKGHPQLLFLIRNFLTESLAGIWDPLGETRLAGQ